MHAPAITLKFIPADSIHYLNTDIEQGRLRSILLFTIDVEIIEVTRKIKEEEKGI